MQFRVKFVFKLLSKYAFKNIPKMVKNSLDLAFNFHLKICLDLDFAPNDKVVEFKFLNNFYFYPKS
jgi:hypothetical protein